MKGWAEAGERSAGGREARRRKKGSFKTGAHEKDEKSQQEPPPSCPASDAHDVQFVLLHRQDLSHGAAFRILALTL